MVVVLTDEHKADLALLRELPPAALAEFAKIAVEFLRNGPNPKIYSGAAQKLEVSPSDVKGAVEALSFVFAECAKSNITELDFLDTLLVLAFPQEINEGLKNMYEKYKKEIRSILAELSFGLPHYDNISWRLDVQVASRTLNKQVEPIFTIKLETLEPEPRVQYLQTDIVNLKHIVAELERGLQEMKSAHCRRIIRNVK
mmetsp:Transcript_24231/g.41386  ORF Transcript_24231/g.41386 Transcript_24231/m.41386 type:complete len:199 (+) Transcript_24231:19-615(+)